MFNNVIAVCVCVFYGVTVCLCMVFVCYVCFQFGGVMVCIFMVYLSLVMSWCVFYGVMTHCDCALNCLLSELLISWCLCHMATWSQSWVFCFGMY